MLESFDAEILAVDDALNTLACMLLDCDALSEISVDEDADYILDSNILRKLKAAMKTRTKSFAVMQNLS